MIRIQALITATLLPEDYDSDGFLYFDLRGNTDVSFFKNIEQLSDINEITEEAVLGFTLPRTDKNYRILQSFDLENIKDEPLPISVIASVSGQAIRQNRLTVLNVSDESNDYECELERPSDHWISGIEYPLCDIDFGEYTFTAQTVRSRNEAFPYVDGDSGIAFPPANYGVFLGRSNSPTIPGKPYFLENYRPWINPLKVLQDGFCKLGWGFECPLLETPYGRSLATYILKDDLSIEPQQAGQVFAAATKDEVVFDSAEAGQLYVDKIIFDTITIGAANFINNELFAAPGIFDIGTNFSVGAGFGIGPVEFILEVYKSSGGSASLIGSSSVTVFPFPNAPANSAISINIEDVDLLSNELVFLQISYRWSKSGASAIVPTIFYDGNLSVIRKAGIPLEGDNVVFSELIDCNYLFADYLKGITHLFRFKFITDWARKTVVALTTDTQDVFGNTVDGYYLDTISSVKPLRESRSVLNKRNTNNRYALLAFKPSTDPGLQRIVQPQDDPLFSKRFDYGSDLPDQTIDFINPFFEPTRNDSSSEVTLNATPLNMPYLWDNTDGKLSFKIQPRIVYFMPEVQQYVGLTSGPTQVQYRGVAASGVNYGWAFQLQPLSHFFFPPPFRVEENVIYGDVKNDLSKYWARDLFAKIVLKEKSYKKLSTFDEYLSLSFRNLYKVEYDGREYLARLISIENQQTAVDLADVTFQLEPQVPLCDLLQEPDEAEICNNNPKLTISTDVDCCEDTEGCTDCILVEVGGTNNSTVDTQIIEASFNNGDTWVEQSTFCCSDHDGEPFLIRLTTTFTDDCSDIVRTRLIDPCEILKTDIELVCVFDENCATLEVNGVQDCESVDLIEYTINGGDRVTWDDEPVCLESGDRINWFVTITTECCGEVELTTECFAEIIGCEFEPEVVCSFSPDGSTLTLLPTGDLPDNVALDILEYRCPGDTCWTRIDCSDIGTAITPQCECVEVKRVVVSCLPDCPVKCYITECCFELPECVECIEQCATVTLSEGQALILSVEKDGVATDVTGSIGDRTINCIGDNTTFENNLASFLKTQYTDCDELYVKVTCNSASEAEICIIYSKFTYESLNFFVGASTVNRAITGCEECTICEEQKLYINTRAMTIRLNGVDEPFINGGIQCTSGGVLDQVGDFESELIAFLTNNGDGNIDNVVITIGCALYNGALDPNGCFTGATYWAEVIIQNSCLELDGWSGSVEGNPSCFIPTVKSC